MGLCLATGIGAAFLLRHQGAPARRPVRAAPQSWPPNLAELPDRELHAFTQKCWAEGNRPVFELCATQWERRGRGDVPSRIKETWPEMGWRA